MADCTTWPAARLAAAIRLRELSSRDLLELQLAHIERHDRRLGAVVMLDAEGAKRAANAADAAVARGDSLGPLHGLPVTVKDALETAGMRSTGGATELAAHIPPGDAPAVARLRAAGAIVIGKTNVPRWSGDMQTFNELFGTTRNPWAPQLTCGGSSGGAAVAVACGFSSFELGTDVGGSIRIPAHFCGIYGLRPTWGIVPQRGYLDHVGGGVTDVDINVVGPLARAAEDLDLLLGVLAAPDGDAARAWRLELPDPDVANISGLRVGAWLDDPVCPVQTEYGQLLRAAADALADAGADVSDSRPALDAEELFQTYWKLLMAAISPSFPDPQGQVLAGSHRDWLRLAERRAFFADAWREWFADHDVLLCPVVAMPAFPHDHSPAMSARTVEIDGRPRPYVETARWTGIVGSVGLPAVTAPIGRTVAGLPVGVQIVAPWYGDRRAIRVAGWLADLVGGYEPPPLDD